MKRTILSMAAVIVASALLPTSAYPRGSYRDGETPEIFIQAVGNDQSRRTAKRQTLSIKKHLLDSFAAWTCGIQAFETFYNTEERRISLQLYSELDVKSGDPLGNNKVVGKQVLSKDVKGAKFSVERFGNYTMLVERNASGSPIKAFYKIPREHIHGDCRHKFLRRILAGNYVLEDGNHAIFGPKMEHYTSLKWAEDPGYYYLAEITDNRKSVDIIYGDSRVSHGDPSSPKYGKMPGGGGAGALMGPMTIRVTPTVGGLKVESIHDEPFVSHNPSFKDNPTLSIVETPFSDIPGRYAFASAMPLTHSLLRLFPREALTLMRCEISARHGATFTDPKIQSYFDVQSWYKKSKTKVTLTDIEKFNVALIKLIEKEK